MKEKAMDMVNEVLLNKFTKCYWLLSHLKQKKISEKKYFIEDSKS